MNLLPFLFLLFLLVPVVEIFILIQVGSWFGALPTVGLVVLTAVIGAVLVRAQGFRTLMRVQETMNRGEVPATELIEAAVIVIAGVGLLTPGFVTDAVGFACLVPPLRQAVIRSLVARHLSRADGSGAHRGRIIEGDYRREDDR